MNSLAYQEGLEAGISGNRQLNPYRFAHSSRISFREWLKGHNEGIDIFKKQQSIMPKEDNSLKADFVYSLTSLLMAEIRRLERQVEGLTQANQNIKEMNERVNKNYDNLKEDYKCLADQNIQLQEEVNKLKTQQGG